MESEEKQIVIKTDAENMLGTLLGSIVDKHKKVSETKTPPIYVHALNEQRKKPDRLLYIDAQYMRNKANELYPGWSWEIVNSFPIGDAYYVIHGRLAWYETASNGSFIKRTGDMVDAHRITKSRDTGDYVDVGNDIKSANTDCLKKALNLFLNIGDDIYGWEDLSLSEKEIDELKKLAKLADKEEDLLKSIEEGRVSKETYGKYKQRLNELIKEGKGV